MAKACNNVKSLLRDKAGEPLTCLTFYFITSVKSAADMDTFVYVSPFIFVFISYVNMIAVKHLAIERPLCLTQNIGYINKYIKV